MKHDQDCACPTCQNHRRTAWQANGGAFAVEPGEDPRPICGAVAKRGVDCAPLACAYEPGHPRLHSWAGIPHLLHNGQGEIVAGQQATDQPY